MDENKRSSVSQAATIEEMGAFWDTHDVTDYDTDAPDVTFSVARAVQIEAELLVALEQQALIRGISVETLVNVWLQQKLDREVHPAAA
ncbi:MAG: BrnA antitoxin family protein [Chloroflexaceae bacterium]|jgi:hypothetical protein|nr:BrnA antitoxin family protein [Chloroflexaceae bacterium]